MNLKGSLSLVRYQSGQSMVEYAIVTGALFTALFMVNEGCEDYDNCIQQLQVAMHDNYDGYSASISAVHQYGEFTADLTDSTWVDGDDDGGSDSGGGSTGGSDDEYVQDVTSLTTSGGTGGFGTVGYLASDGTTVLDSNGNEIGTFDPDTGLYTNLEGTTVAATPNNFVVDQDGNLVYLTAVVDCFSIFPNPPVVYGFGYPVESGTFFSSSSKEELDIPASLCQAPAYNALTRTGGDAGGSIVNGYYYANDFTNSSLEDAGVDFEGEVVYDSLTNQCVALVNGWDEGSNIDPDDPDETLDDEETYAEEYARLNDPDYVLGYLDSGDYFDQLLNGASAYPFSCVSSRTLSPP